MMKRIFSFFGVLILCSIQAQGGFYMEEYEPGKGLTFASSKVPFELGLRSSIQSTIDTRAREDGEQLTNRIRVRRARFEINAKALRDKLSVRIKTDFALPFGNAEDELNNGALLDAYISYEVTDFLDISFGQRSTWTDNRELKTSSDFLSFVERSRLTSAFATIRDFGIFLDWRWKIKQVGFKAMTEVTSGEGQNNFTKNYGGLKYGGRLNIYPLGYFRSFGEFRTHDLAREWQPKFCLGAAYSYNQGVSSRRGRAGGSMLYLDENDKELLPDYGKLVVDLLLKYRGFSFLGEYCLAQAYVPDGITQRVRNDGSTSTTFDPNVEDYIKGRMMLGSAINAQVGYVFKSKTTLDARYTKLMADEFSFLNNPTFYNRNNYYTFAIGQYLFNDMAKFQVELGYNDSVYDDSDPNNVINTTRLGENLNGMGEWIGRVMFQFKL